MGSECGRRKGEIIVEQEQQKIAVLAESGYRSVMGLKSVLEHAGIDARVMQPPNAGKG